MTDDLIKEFLIDGYENLERLDLDLVALERDPHDADRLASAFRTIHTIKGVSGFLAFSKLEAITHAGESLLAKMRDGKLVLDQQVTSALLRLVDAVREALGHIEKTHVESDADYADLIAELKALNDGAAATVPTVEPPAMAAAAIAAAEPPAPAPPPPTSVVAVPPPPVTSVVPPPPSAAATLTMVFAAPDEMPAPAADAPVAAAPVTPPAAVPARAEADSAAAAMAAEAERRDRRVSDDRRTGEDRRAPGSAVADAALRVDVNLLDKLMNLVGELVLARNQILQFTSEQHDSGLTSATQRLDLVTSELQEGVMKTRMQPIGNIWSKFPRIVRDVGTQCGKEVRLEMEGKETDLDKTIIEAIKDPLTHIVRNSVDHGIEPPAVRLERGKPVEGLIRLRAFHEGGQINIEISDDGGGIDPEKLRRVAVRRGVITEDQANRMGDHEAVRLIFHAGFSTADTVSNISGRGVGMDVVKTNIEKIGGQVDVQSRVGEGTLLKIKIPLTLAIIPALIVSERDGARYAIPQVNLLELVRLEQPAATTAIERINNAPFYRLRGNLLPLVYLDQELTLDTSARGASDAINIVVLRADDKQFGLVVDTISDTEEIVVKPLSKQLKGVTVFAGATIMGDGTVALILDVLGLAQRASVVSGVRDRSLSEVEEHVGASAADGRQTLLLFRAGAHERMAIPLAQVARLEEFPATAIERSGDRRVVQYRGEIMPLITFDPDADAAPQDGRSQQAIVFHHGSGHVALVVDAILDIVTEHVSLHSHLTRAGVLGSAVIQQRVTELVDVCSLLESVSMDTAGEKAA